MNRKMNASWLLLLALTTFAVSGCTFLTTEPVSRPPASKSGYDQETRLRSEVVDYARGFLGAGYRYGGRDPKKGFDCSGFTYYVMNHFEVPLSTSSRYQADEGKKVEVRQVRPGDLVFFKRTPMGRVFHVALVVANDRQGLQVIHSTSRGVVIDNISKSDYWRPKLSSARNVLSD